MSIAWGESVDINFSIPSGVDVNPGVFIYYPSNYPHSTFQHGYEVSVDSNFDGVGQNIETIWADNSWLSLGEASAAGVVNSDGNDIHPLTYSSVDGEQSIVILEDSNGDFAVNSKFNLPDVPYQISTGYYNSAPNIAPNLTDATGFTIVSALQGGGNSGYSSY